MSGPTADPVRAALYGKLSGSSTVTNLLAVSTGIYHRTAPAAAKFPCLIFHRQADTTEYTFHGESDDELWLVKAVAQGGSAAPAEQLSAAVRSVLNGAQLTITGRNLIVVKRVSGVSFGEVADGEQYHHEGHFFQVQHQPAA